MQVQAAEENEGADGQSEAGRATVLRPTTDFPSAASFSRDAVAVIARKRRELKRAGRMAEVELWGFVQVLLAKVRACSC